jgi:hypothetical protein
MFVSRRAKCAITLSDGTQDVDRSGTIGFNEVRRAINKLVRFQSVSRRVVFWSVEVHQRLAARVRPLRPRSLRQY